jgi:hypothetical protein
MVKLLVKFYSYIFICDFCNDAVTGSGYTASNDLRLANNKVDKMWKELVKA